MWIDKKSRIPLYVQLMNIILAQISSGELKELEQLPSERALCEKYDVSRTTVRQAMIELENEGHIFIQHGKGTFVSRRSYMQKLGKFYSFSEEIKKLGKEQTNKVISFEVKKSSKRIANKLEIGEQEEVLEFKRLRFVDGVPILFETTYLPNKLFPTMMKSDLEDKPLYDVMRNQFQLSIDRAVESFKADGLSSQVASYLQEKVGSPAMQIERIAYSNSQIVEYTVGIAHGEKYTFSIELD